MRFVLIYMRTTKKKPHMPTQRGKTEINSGGFVRDTLYKIQKREKSKINSGSTSVKRTLRGPWIGLSLALPLPQGMRKKD